MNITRCPTVYIGRSSQGSPISDADKEALIEYERKKHAKADAFAERARQSALARHERLAESRRPKS